MYLCGIHARARRPAAHLRHHSNQSGSIATPPMGTAFLHQSARTDAMWPSCLQPQIWSIVTPTAWRMSSCATRAPGLRPAAFPRHNAFPSLPTEHRRTTPANQRRSAPPGATLRSARWRQTSIQLPPPTPPVFSCGIPARVPRPAARLRHSS